MVRDTFEAQREWMVQSQLQARGIRDPKVLEAFRRVPRHAFVDKSLRRYAYQDHPLGIGGGQTISQPYIVALMSEALSLEGCERVLEVGTGSGYQTAILAELTQEVYTVERIPSLRRQAEKTLRELGYENIRFVDGDGSEGYAPGAPYEGIVVTAAARRLPDALDSQLAEGGRLIIPIGGALMQTLYRFEKTRGALKRKDLGGVRFVPLVDT